MAKIATVRIGDAIEIGAETRIELIRQDGGKIMLRVESPAHVRIRNRFMLRDLDGNDLGPPAPSANLAERLAAAKAAKAAKLRERIASR